MKIGIIGAMEEEIRILVPQIQQCQSHTVASFEFYSGLLQGHEITLVQSGIGKVNASLSVALLVEHFGVELIINTGSAGGLGQGLQVGDVVVADRLIHHDVDVTAFGYRYGQMAGMPASYQPAGELVATAVKTCQRQGKVVHQGLVVSGDVFVAGAEPIAKIKAHFPDALACEMESAAIAQAAHVLGVPYLIIRAISDSADSEAHISFDEFILLAGKASAELVVELLGELV